MYRSLSLVLVIGAANALAPAASAQQPGAGSYAVPATIAADCSRDVSAQLRSWIASVPDNSTLSLRSGACYRIDGPLKIVDRFGLTFEGMGATFRAFTPGDQDRRHVWFIGGGDHTVRNLIVRGANPFAGTGDKAYQASKAFQHGFAFHGVQGGLLDQVQVYDVYGDFVYLGKDVRTKPDTPSRDIVVRDSTFQRNGRQGIAITHAENITIQGNYLAGMRRSTFDLEPNSAGDVIRNVRIVGNTTGGGRLLWLASGGPGYNVNDIHIIGNTMTTRASGSIMRVETPPGGTRGPFIVAGNSFIVGGTEWSGLHLIRVRDTLVLNNTMSFLATRKMTAVGGYGASDLVAARNLFLDARVPLYCNEGSSGCLQAANTTDQDPTYVALPR